MGRACSTEEEIRKAPLGSNVLASVTMSRLCLYVTGASELPQPDATVPQYHNATVVQVASKDIKVPNALYAKSCSHLAVLLAAASAETALGTSTNALVRIVRPLSSEKARRFGAEEYTKQETRICRMLSLIWYLLLLVNCVY